MKRIYALVLLVFVLSYTSHSQSTILNEDFEGGAIPANWTMNMGNATEGWQVTNSLITTYLQVPAHTYFAVVTDDNCNCDMSEVTLTSPVINLSTSTNTHLTFDAYYVFQYADESAKVEVSTDGGSTWTEVADLPSANTFVWHNVDIDLSAYDGNNNVLIRFNYSDGGQWGLGWAIDNVKVFPIPQLDAEITKTHPPYIPVNKDFKPVAFLKNVGTTTLNDVDITFELIDVQNNVVSTYQQSYNSLGMAYGEEKSLSPSTPWNVNQAGSYSIKAIVSYSGDSNANNDTAIATSEAIDFDYSNLKANEGYVFDDGKFCKFNHKKNSKTTINDYSQSIPAISPLSMEFINGVLYGITTDGINDYLTMINGDGNYYQLGTLSSDDFIYTNAITWDRINNTIYTITAQGFGDSELRKFNLTDLSYDLVGIASTQLSVIGMDIDPVNQQIYAITYNDNGVYTINPQSAQMTKLSLLDPWSFGGTNYEIVYNEADTSLYLSASYYDNGGINLVGFLAEYDLTTNTGTALMELSDNPYTVTFALLDTATAPVGISETITNDMSIKMYPNPVTNNTLFINNDNPYNVHLQLYNLNGQLILQERVNTGVHSVNISNLASGIYMARISSQNRMINKKIIIR